MKNLLLIGDSIRMGYDKSLKKTLEGRANVIFPTDNCRFASYLLRHFHEYLGYDYICNVKSRKIDNNIYILYADGIFPMDCKANRRIDKDIIPGIFYVVATDDNKNVRSLTDLELLEYYDHFKSPDTFTDDEKINAYLDAFMSGVEESVE